MENAPAALLKVMERTLQFPSASASSRSEPVKIRSAVPLLGGALVVQLLSLLHLDPIRASPLQVNVAAWADRDVARTKAANRWRVVFMGPRTVSVSTAQAPWTLGCPSRRRRSGGSRPAKV